MLKRILLTTDAVGGVWRYSMELARGFAARGASIELAVLGPPPDPEQQREAADIPNLRVIVTGLPLDWLAATPDDIARSADALAGMASRLAVHTVQVHAPALVGHTAWPVPVIAMAHSCVATWWQAVRAAPLPADLAWREAATAIGITRADAVIAPSASFADALRTQYKARRPIEIILNGRTPGQAVQTERRPQALAVGRLWDEAKNLAVLDAAAAKSRWPILAGGPIMGPNGGSVEARHLKMRGPLDAAALANEYARSAIFVSSAYYEPFGLAVLEAAQAGCALVLSDIPTFRELWAGAAILVPPDAPDQFAEAIENLLSDPEIRGRQAAKALRRAGAFNVQQMIDATWAVHAHLLGSSRTAA